SGMSGILLWNYFYEMEEYYARPDEKRGFEFTHDLASREFLRTVRKSYALEGTLVEPVYFAYAHANPPGQVPMMIGEASDGIGNSVAFDVADDLTQATAKVRPQLWLHFVNLGPEDKIEFFMKGQPIRPD